VRKIKVNFVDVTKRRYQYARLPPNGLAPITLLVYIL